MVQEENKRRMSRKRFVWIVVIITAALLAACSPSDAESTGEPAAEPTGGPAEDEPTPIVEEPEEPLVEPETAEEPEIVDPAEPTQVAPEAAAITPETAPRVAMMGTMTVATAPLIDAAWRPAADLAAVTSPTGIYLFDMTAGQQLISANNPQAMAEEGESLVTEPSNVAPGEIAFAPDGSTMAVSPATQEGTVRLYDLENAYKPSEEPLSDFNEALADAGAISAAFSPDGVQLATGDAAGRMTVWSLDDQSQVHTVDVRGALAESSGEGSADLPDTLLIRSLRFSPDGTRLAASIPLESGVAVVAWQAESGENLTLITPGEQAESPPTAALISPRWDRVAFVIEQAVLIVPFEGGGDVVRIDAPAFVEGVTFNPTGDVLAVSSGAGEGGEAGPALTLWNPADGSQFATLEGVEEVVQGMAFSPEGRLLLTGDGGGNIALWGIPLE